MKASFLIVNWNTFTLTAQAVESILAFEKDGDYEVLIVDNASVDGSAEFLLRRFSDARVRLIPSPRNLGFAGGNNLAAQSAQGDWLILFNSDAYLTEPILDKMIAEASRFPDPCVLACRLRNADGSTQVSTGRFPSLSEYFSEIFGSTGAKREADLRAQEALGDSGAVDWISGAFLMAPRAAYQKLGGMDGSIFMYAEDVDFCRKAAFDRIPRMYTCAVSAVHIGGASVGQLSLRSLLLTDQGRLAYFRKWHGVSGALALRAIFLLRSLQRAALFLVLGIAGNPQALRKARVHVQGIFALLRLR